MDTSKLKKFAQAARNLLIDQVTSKLDMVLDDASAARRENPEAVKDLEGAIRTTSRDQVIEKVAYTWFNRFTALRFMDANGYTSIQVVSPTEGQTRPEILSEAMAGHIDVGVATSVKDRIAALLDSRSPSSDPQGEAYRLLLVASCNQWHGPMPFLFEKIDDFTELLMPEDLLSQSSILAELRDVMTEEACQDVEIIGWLYQFYISEKKDGVFAGLKKNKKITAENIPAATQLFTPHWIVRYLVENSLGRLWLLNKPQSKLAEQMDYYIAPEEPETNFLKIGKPEEIKVCDPACGSGHMLTYAFDLLYAIYEEEGYEADRIPALILTHNLTGVEIDDRAGALAAFALAMKAAAKLGRRRFLRMEAKPDICVLQNVAFTPAEMQDVLTVVGKDLFTDELRETLGQFEQAKNFGSLIVPKLRDPAETLRVVEARDFGGDLLLKEVQERVVTVLRMAESLSPKYHVVVANPPYLGGKGMNGPLQGWLDRNYGEAAEDLYSAFTARAERLLISRGISGFITMDAWAFAPAFKEFRRILLLSRPIILAAHLGARAFDTISGEVVSTIAFLQENTRLKSEHRPAIIDLRKGRSEFEKMSMFAECKLRHAALKQSDFLEIDGTPFAYWIPKKFIQTLSDSLKLVDVAKPRSGLTTSDNDRFLRNWWEVSEFNPNIQSIDYDPATYDKWVPINGGSNFRRWYGSNLQVLRWEGNGRELRSEPGATMANPDFQFKPGVTWSKISGTSLSVRRTSSGFMFTAVGLKAFPEAVDVNSICGLLNSKLVQYMVPIFSPSLTILSGDIAKYPYVKVERGIDQDVEDLVGLSKSDWDAYETSWDFTTLPLLSPDNRADSLEDTYTRLRAHWQGMTDEMQALEEKNNRIFIDAYGLQDELTPEVLIEEITLTCNPAYRYGVKGSEKDRETRLRADTMAEFLSYAVGCMFGRYSLDKPGLILANQGETFENYLAHVPEPSFTPDDDNVIPVLDGDWFPDDITERFRLLLRTTFGEAHFRENLKYIEDSLGKDIRKYFTKDFYADHVKRYKKRPIYWMFSSPKGTFNALIYMHRYRADTVSVLLNDYLREFINKLEAERSRLEKLADDESTSQQQRTKAVKDATKIASQLDELRDWERDVIFPLAQQKIEIDLDDGVKANYPKFGTALKKIPGVSE